jgi:O-antigen ligase
MLSYVKKRVELNYILISCVIFCTLNGGYGIYQQLFDVDLEKGRAGGLGDIDQNVYASGLTAFLPIGYYFFLHGKNVIRKGYLVALLSMVGGVFASVSRAAILALCYVGARLFFRNIKRISTFFIAGILVIVVLNFAVNWYQKRGVATVKKSFSGSTQLDASADSRFALWNYAFRLWLHHPVLGVGVYQYAESVRVELGVARHKQPAHNTFIEVLAEQGLVGFFFYMSVFVLSCRTLQRLSMHEELYIKELAGYLNIGFVGFLICSFFISNQWNYLLWIYLALPLLLEKVVFYDTE